MIYIIIHNDMGSDDFGDIVGVTQDIEVAKAWAAIRGTWGDPENGKPYLVKRTNRILQMPK